VVGQGSLLFTGFPLCIAVAAALGVIALGLTMRRLARVTAQPATRGAADGPLRDFGPMDKLPLLTNVSRGEGGG
jgi:hypothetical protein